MCTESSPGCRHCFHPNLRAILAKYQMYLPYHPMPFPRHIPILMEPMIDIFLEGYEKHTIHGLGHLSSIHHFLGMILQMQYYLRNIFELSKNGGTPIAGWVIMENAIKNGLYTPIILIYYINIYIYIWNAHTYTWDYMASMWVINHGSKVGCTSKQSSYKPTKVWDPTLQLLPNVCDWDLPSSIGPS